MVGHGSMDHLHQLVSSDCNEYRRTLLDEETKSYKTMDNVYVKYGDSMGSLYVGHYPGFSEPNSFGPEVLFGWTVGEAFANETILLIKTAWGGKSLAVDFRSPSSGTGNYSGVKPIDYGQTYRLMITDILTTLDSLEDQNRIPEYNTEGGYELSGFVWLQGWSDMLRSDYLDYHDKLLTKFIRDVRLDLDAPDLPFVIGELGMHGYNLPRHAAGRILAMRAKQEQVALKQEFRGTAIFVRTAEFAFNQSDGPEFDDPHYDWSAGPVYEPVEHYWGRADTFFHIGKALGLGALELMGISALDDDENSCEERHDSNIFKERGKKRGNNRFLRSARR